MRITIRSNIPALRQKLQIIRNGLEPTMHTAMEQGATDAALLFSNAAPKGKEAGSTIPGDTPGPLSSSFAVRMAFPRVSVVCTQPTKLLYVTQGTGIYGPRGQRIVPLTKKALYWPGADHPVKSVAGQKPNDFVTPLIAQGEQTIADAVRKAVIDLIKGAFA